MKHATSFLLGAGLIVAAQSAALGAEKPVIAPPRELPANALSMAPQTSATGAATPDQSPADSAPDRQKLVVSDAELADNRGGQAVVIGNQTLNSNTLGNVLNGNYTAGSVNISDTAFANYNGIGNFAINTGAQVSLQSAMNLTINIAP